MTAYSEITKCRISGSRNLIPMLSLGEQYLTGVFPKSVDAKLSKGPLDLVWCPDSGLLQLKQSYSQTEMYGENYGYRSGLNRSMVDHLKGKAEKLERLARVSDGDVILDIGSNDGTLLKSFSTAAQRIGIDPTANKFRHHYGNDIALISDFFSGELFEATLPGCSAKIITSIAMFYDLECPLHFVRDIESCLTFDGIWHCEQSYMPSMLRTNSYDSICHEHLEFYSFRVIKKLMEEAGLRVIDVEMNDINGGSFAVTACKEGGPYESNATIINWLLVQEDRMGLDTPRPYREFETRVFSHRKDLRSLIDALVADGKKICAYGASTKGNVLLQFCGLSTDQIICVAEVNEDKFGSFTPGTNIPIVSETEAKAMKPDYMLVLPWHFKHGILEREREYLAAGGKLIFPLPEITIV